MSKRARQPLPPGRAGRRVAEDQVQERSRSSSSAATPTRRARARASARCSSACHERRAACATWARSAPASTRGCCRAWRSACTGCEPTGRRSPRISSRAQKGAHWVRPRAGGRGGVHRVDPGWRHPSPELQGAARGQARGRRSSRRCPCETASDTGTRAEAPAQGPADAGAGGAVNGVTLTHPDRVFWPAQGCTKRDLVAYYDLVAERMLPYVVTGRSPWCAARAEWTTASEAPQRERRPARLLLPQAPGRRLPRAGRPGHDHRVGRPGPYLTITGPASLTALAQMGVLEIHIWGSTWPDIERPDMVVFDLDPGPGVEWPALADGARLVREVLRSVAPGELRQDHRRQGAARGGAAHPERGLEGGRRSSAAGWPRSWWSSPPTASPPTCPRPSATARSTWTTCATPGAPPPSPPSPRGRRSGPPSPSRSSGRS